MAGIPTVTVTVNIGALSNALAAAIGQATSHAAGSTDTGDTTAQQPASSSAETSSSSADIRNVGRPKTDVDVQSIKQLRRLHYSWTKIANILGISRATLYRRLEGAGISTDDGSHLTNAELDSVISSIKTDHPNDGEVLMQGHLVRMNIRVPRQALRDSIHRVDHTNVVSRRHAVVRRRVYSVPFPNYLWHIDGHHKMIRWRFVIHGGVDGFSRCVDFLGCSDNNRAATVLSLFTGAVAQFGLPHQVRSDHGGENVRVWQYMIAAHQDYSAVITGSSVHNERVERLWRDVHRCVASVFTAVFRSLESSGKLDCLNEVDLYCLHYVFLPRIQKCLSEFQDCWNSHSLSTEGNKSPLQLFLEGLMHTMNDQAGRETGVPNVDVTDLISDCIEVPRIRFMPCAALIEALSVINPLQPCSDSGLSFYVEAIEVCGSHLRLSCADCSVN